MAGRLRVLFFWSCLLTPALLLAQPADRPSTEVVAIGTEIIPLDLLMNAAVRDELRLTEQQQKDVSEITQNYRNSFSEIMLSRDSASPSTLTPEARQDEVRSRYSRFQQEAEKDNARLKQILTEAQWSRLRQIHWQHALLFCRVPPDLAAILNLTEEQSSQIKKQSLRLAKDRVSLRSMGDTNSQERIHKMQIEAEKFLLALLNADQTATLNEQLGPRFDVSQIKPWGGEPPVRLREVK